jgi:hypothetical protein
MISSVGREKRMHPDAAPKFKTGFDQLQWRIIRSDPEDGSIVQKRYDVAISIGKNQTRQQNAKKMLKMQKMAPIPGGGAARLRPISAR